MLFVVGPALMLLLAWAVWWTAALLGAPANDLATGFLGDSFGLLVLVQTYVVMIMMVPAILCALGDPVETKLAIWAFTASVFSLLPRVFCLMEGLGARAAYQILPAPPKGVHFDTRTMQPIPALRFSYGTSPQLE